MLRHTHRSMPFLTPRQNNECEDRVPPKRDFSRKDCARELHVNLPTKLPFRSYVPESVVESYEAVGKIS